MTSTKYPISAVHRVALIFVSCLLSQVPLHGQRNSPPLPSLHPSSLADVRVSPIRVEIAPERPDWTYEVGEQIRFTISARVDRHALGGLEIRYRVGPEMLPSVEQVAKLPANGEPLLIDAGALNEPGFVRCDVTLSLDGRDYHGRATAGVSPGAIRPTQVDPEDFDAFWAASLEQLATVPMAPEITHLPERSTPTVEVYHVGIRTTGKAEARVYGILCVPRAEGSFPAVLELPSAGMGPRSGDVKLAERGVITFQIGIHGVPVNLETKAYGPLYPNDYPAIHLESREDYYYRRVYLNCVRANDFLVSHPKFDGQNLFVMGASQGGQLSIVTAALDPRVKALAAHCPAYCDITGYLQGRAGGWPHLTRPNGDGSPAAHTASAKIRTTGYYDVVNFAKRVKAPGYYALGYNDVVCPPTSIYAAYNVITAPKTLLLALEDGHWASGERPELDTLWIEKQLGLGK